MVYEPLLLETEMLFPPLISFTIPVKFDPSAIRDP